jgi:TM2 domain-containing membrane protein YozV
MTHGIQKEWCLQILKKYPEAYEAFNQAVIINPTNLTAIKNRNNAQKFIIVAPDPNFSVEPSKGTDVPVASHSCPHCGAEITHQEAEICPNCGVRVKVAPQIKGEKSQGIAALLSFFFPGLGQVFDGNLTRGVIFLIGTFVGTLFFFVPGLIVWIYQIYDAYSIAKKMNAGEIPFKEADAVQIILYFVLFAVIIIIFVIIIAAVIAAFVFGMAGSNVYPYG